MDSVSIVALIAGVPFVFDWVCQNNKKTSVRVNSASKEIGKREVGQDLCAQENSHPMF